MSGMAVPEWAKNAQEDLAKAHQGLSYEKAGASIRQLTPVTDFSTHFAEYEIKGNDVLVHLFPRGGNEDRWYPESYNAEGTYIPGRREVKASVSFPKDAAARIKAAVDAMWQGSVAVEEVPELGAFVVQFQGAKTTSAVVGVDKFVDKFCEELDHRLE